MIAPDQQQSARTQTLAPPSTAPAPAPTVRSEPLTFPSWPQYGQEERRGLMRVLDQDGWWRMAGSEVDLFEREFAGYSGAPHAIGTSTGTHALELALGVLGVRPGDEVLLPAFTFISCSLAVQRLGAIPIPVDVLPNTYCLDVEAAAALVGARTRVVMPVHLAGQLVDMDALMSLAGATGIAILQDAAHAHGARWRGRRVGEFGTCAAFSFQNGKLMTAGEGGALLLPDDETAERAYLQHSCGRPADDRVYRHLTQGSNYRMNEFSASVLRGQLSRLDSQILLREQRWARLRTALAAIPGVVPQDQDPRVDQNSHYMAMIRIPRLGGDRRQRIVNALNARGVPAFVAFPPVYQTDSFWIGPTREDRQAIAARCPVSEEIGRDCIWFHHRVLLADEPVLDRMVDVVAENLAQAG